MRSNDEPSGVELDRLGRLQRWLRRFVRPALGNSRGASLVEYMMVTGFIGLVAIGAFNQYGRTIHAGLQNEAQRIEGKGLPSAADLLGDLGNNPVCNLATGLCVPGSGNCFGKGTLVATENGDRPIESLRVGERVWASDTSTGTVALRPIVKTFMTPRAAVMDLSLSSLSASELSQGVASEHITVTPNHLFWVEGKGWVQADSLGAAPLASLQGEVSAAPLAERAQPETVYNLEVEEYHSYFIGHAHALVHNGCPTTPPSPAQTALDNSLKRAGLTDAQIAAIESKLNNLPPGQRDAARTNISKAVDLINNTLPADKKQAAINAITQAGTDPNIQGFDDWVKHAQQRTDAATVQNEVNELIVANANSRQGGVVTVGLDQAAKDAAGSNPVPKTFDMQVTDGSGKTTNVEVYTPSGQLQIGDLGTGINHAAEKVIPGNTTGAVEGAVVANWPPPPKNVGGGAVLTTAPNGDTTLTLPNGTTKPQGNMFNTFLDNLNDPSGKSTPAGASSVDSLVVYDQSGNVVKTYTKGATGVWSMSPP